MYEGKTVGVVVPAYNEEEFVGTVIDTMPEFVDRIYAVDDQSMNGTWEEIRRRAETVRRTDDDGSVETEYAGRVVPIRHERNRGVGAAIKRGYRRAHADGMDVVAVMAGDGQMDPGLLDRLLDPLVAGDADYAKGNRLLSGRSREGMSGWRWFGNMMLTWLTRVASGYWQLLDSQNGYTAISARALDQIDLDQVYDGYGFANDLLVRLNVSEVRVAHVAMPAVYGDEQSDIAYASFIPRISLLLLHRFLWRLKTTYFVPGFNPFAVLYGLGLASAGASLVTGTYRLVTAADSDARSDAEAVSAGAVLVGCLLLLVGALFDVRENGGLETYVPEVETE